VLSDAPWRRPPLVQVRSARSVIGRLSEAFRVKILMIDGRPAAKVLELSGLPRPQPWTSLF